MNAVLTLLALISCSIIILVVPTLVAPFVLDYGVITVGDTGKAVLLCAALSSLAGLFSYRQGANGPFLVKVFIAALLARMILGTAIFVFHGQEFFGGDAITYDVAGAFQLRSWQGDRYYRALVGHFVDEGGGSGWGMVYLVAAVYGLIGRNMLAIQFVNAVLGAVTAPIIFLCAQQVFNNFRVSKLAALAVAFYPSLVLWSSQGLKDGPIVFFLALSIFATLKLGERISLRYIAVLLCSLFAVLSLRFYVFYMLSAAIAGSFVVGMRALTATNFVRQLIVIAMLGLGLTYLGITRYANVQLQNFGKLEAIQRSRLDAARSAESGFGKDVDVSTTAGALSAIPLGLLYLLFAPFPWQLVSLRQSLTLPEMIFWWASVPMLVLGLWFSIRYRLRMISPILSFTLMLSLAYSVFQGNVGTAYRQRAQLLVFYFIFVAVGYVLMLEKREEKKRAIMAERQSVADASVASTLARSREQH
ncbi:MAG: glycosyltransferase family 39 protein [Pyrinomonadaceae bacterium]|nr:glycosyltransferase family 39 protein [Pyrinomonadaceae bacterium]